MAVSIVRNQIIDAIINVDKLDTGAVSYAKILSTDIETALASSASATKLATAASIKSYVDSKIVDTFSGGDGIVIDDTGSPDVISVDLATSNPALYFDSNKLSLQLDANKGLVKGAAGASVQLKTEVGGTISVDASGLFVADLAIGNGKLANSTISGKSLGGNLDDLTAGNGLSMTAYNGAAPQAIDLALDGATLSKSGTGVKVSDGGISANQLAQTGGAEAVVTQAIRNSAVTTDKIADSSVTADKVGFATNLDALTTNGATTAFDLGATINAAFATIMVHRNGLMLKQVASSPADVDEFSLSLAGGAGGVSQVTFGAAPASSDSVTVFYIA